MVATFDWPAEVMLDDVEQFRQEYAYHYSLRECAMMLAEVRPGSFVVTWFIPESIVEKLRIKVPRAVLKKYAVTELKIAGRCVYHVRGHQVSWSDVLKSYARDNSCPLFVYFNRYPLKMPCSVVIPLPEGLQHQFQQLHFMGIAL